MSAICLIDTSVFVEILNVPKLANQHSLIIDLLRLKLQDKELLFLPMATILETGNHIAQNGNGDERWNCANRFVTQVKKALAGDSPFQPVKFLEREQLLQWLAEFPESAKRKSGLGDLSIIHDFQRTCSLNHGRKVYIWSLDEHLSSFCREAKL